MAREKQSAKIIRMDKDEKFYKQIEKEYSTNETYREEYEDEYNFNKAASYACNAISIIGACTLLFFELSAIWGFIISTLLCIVLLFFYEYGKRLYVRKYWKKYHLTGSVPALASIILVVIVFGNASLTYFGVKKMAKEFTPEATQMVIDSVSEASALMASISELKAKINDYKTNKAYRVDSGEIAYNIRQKTLPPLESLLIKKETRFDELNSSLTVENKEMAASHSQKKAFRAEVLAGGVLIVEVLFMLFMFHMGRYRFRCKLEKQVASHGKSNENFPNDPNGKRKRGNGKQDISQNGNNGVHNGNGKPSQSGVSILNSHDAQNAKPKKKLPASQNVNVNDTMRTIKNAYELLINESQSIPTQQDVANKTGISRRTVGKYWKLIKVSKTG